MLWLIALCAVGTFSTSVKPDEQTSLRHFLQTLGGSEGFEVAGLELVGADESLALPRGTDTDISISRALRHYNFVVSYSGMRIKRVVILGRKGTSTGPDPEVYVDEAIEETPQGAESP